MDIERMAAERPHLKAPLELYAGWRRYQERASALLSGKGSASAAKEPPKATEVKLLQEFASVFELPPESLAPLEKALRSGMVDFSRLPLDELPALSPPYEEEDLTTLLFLLSRPIFLGRSADFVLEGSEWEGGRCPLCASRPALSSIAAGPRRLLHCSWCGTSGPYRFIGCPQCGCEDAAQLATLVPQEEAGYRVATCDHCRHYLKVVEQGVLSAMTPDLADLASLPLDIVAQDRDYQRAAPNPLGMRRIG